MNYLIKPILASMCLGLSVTGCSVATEPAAVAAKSEASMTKPAMSPTGYSKPGAAIDFAHDFSGRSTVGATQIVNMKIMDRYPGGTVQISVLPSEGITVFENNSQKSFKMSGGENDFQIQFQADREGVHRITILAQAVMQNGQTISRSYSMPVYVGDQYRPVKKSVKTVDEGDRVLQKNGETDGGLIIMDAEETIETSD